jgi:hypothetical protein
LQGLKTMSDCKVDPGVGYRLLEKGETVQPGDEFFVCPDQWERTGYPGMRVGQQGASAPYRRKLPTRKKIYIAGPMRGIPKFNFPAFDDAAERLYNQGWDPINPADIDRDQGFDVDALPADFDWSSLPETLSLRDIIRRDVDALMGADAVYVLPGYERSRGSRAEIALAEWLNLDVIYEAKEPEAPVAPSAINAELHQAAEPHFNWAEGIEALKAAEAAESSNPFVAVFDALEEREAAAAGAQSVKDAFGILKAAIDLQDQEDILETALRITRGDRQAQYGPPDQDFRRTAGMWTALFSHMLQPGVSFEPMHIALAMILLKASRQMHQKKVDNWVDLAGYARCGSICDRMA